MSSNKQTVPQTTNEEDFKVRQLSSWGFKSSERASKNTFILGENKVDVKLSNIWLEVKKSKADVYDMLAQLIFTVWKVKGHQELPLFFGCFDSEKGAIIENYQVHEVFGHTDINWLQTPSNLDEKTKSRVRLLLKEVKIYNLADFGEELKKIQNNEVFKRRHINKNNFIIVYNEWLKSVGTLIHVATNFDGLEKLKPDCYLADLMTDGKKSIGEKLKIILSKDSENYYYKSKEGLNNLFQEIEIKNQQEYLNFWSKYERPPEEEYQEYILDRRDLLQPNNIREQKGAFFTPKVWCDKSKEYIAKAFGKNWQDEYYIWDCACGTGNLEQGLVNQERVFMSTLDEADLLIIKQLKLMPDATHFQFDFLNDEWKPIEQGGKLPNKLWKVIKETPEKLIIYINPPYAENGTAAGRGANLKANKAGISMTLARTEMMARNLGRATTELFMQFYYRIYKNIPRVKICSFSTLKNCNAPNFEKWRQHFQAHFKGGFICQAKTFDNVKGSFPISFQMWDCDTTKKFLYDHPIDEDLEKEFQFNVLNNEGDFEGVKWVRTFKSTSMINRWLKNNNTTKEEALCYISRNSNDFQHQIDIALYNKKPGTCEDIVTKSNIIDALIYVAVRLCIPATWLNDRDQFTKPFKAGKVSEEFALKHQELVKSQGEYQYEADDEFIGNCIVFALFEKNNTNWQIFQNSQIGLSGVDRDMTIHNLLIKGRVFSKSAQDVLNIAQQIYTLYHKNFGNPNAGWKGVYQTLEKGNLYTKLKKAKKELATEVAFGTQKHGFLRT